MKSFRRLFFSTGAALVILMAAGIPIDSQDSLISPQQEKELIAGRNVNMVSGTTLPAGDPWLQRQNEPSIAVSTRNPLHLLAGANDYRTVDIPMEGIGGELPGKEQMQAPHDAWLGVFKSFDGGQSWTSTLLPGFPQDKSAEGISSPLKYNPESQKGFRAAADPVVRAGTNGLFFYSGIAFNREKISGRVNSVVFAARFIDNNNVEGGDSIKYLDTKIIADDGMQETISVDKPWIAVDVPSKYNKTVTIDGQKIPIGNVYVAYSVFSETGNSLSSKIVFRRSTDCGETWESPVVLSKGHILNQGATIAVDPRENGHLYVAWRRFDSGTQTSAIIIARSTNSGKSFNQIINVASLPPFPGGSFDQPSKADTPGPPGTAFRTNSYPTMAIDDKGIVYLAWAQRGYGPTGEAHIVLTTSKDGIAWTSPAPIESLSYILGHQFMPSIAFASGKLTMVWYDQRDDFYGEAYGFGDWICDNMPLRHTIDVWSAQAETRDYPYFNWTSTQVTRYLFSLEADGSGTYTAYQAQFNPPNYPLFKSGTLPFHGDYIDITPSPMFVLDSKGRWHFNTEPADNPLFHITWTDNRDVRPPSDGNWVDYTPANSAQDADYISPDRPSCQGGQRPGMRNQNIYTSQITTGIETGSPTNTKALDLNVPRAFVIFVKNNTELLRSFRLTIANQPPVGQASFLQFDFLDTLDVSIAPFSTISRQVFVDSTDLYASVRININEIDAPGGSILPGGIESSVLLNGDPTSPGISGGEETHQPEIGNPNIRNWYVNPNIVNPNIRNPNIVNTDIVNPNIRNVVLPNQDVVNPNIVNADMFNPNIRNADLINPNIVNPNIRNANLEDASIIDVIDVEWPVKNAGNTTSSLTFKIITKEALPEGIYAQLIIYKVHYTPAVAGEALQNDGVDGCQLALEPHHEILLNVVNPNIVNPNIVNPNIRNPNIRNAAIENATFVLSPDEEAIVNLRIIQTSQAQVSGRTLRTAQVFPPLDIMSFVESLGGAVTSQSVDSKDAEQGIEEPPAAATMLIITTSSLPPGTVGKSYPQAPYTTDEATLKAVGGKEPYSWWVNPADLPPGLTLNAATGQIFGTPQRDPGKTYPYTYSFMAQVTDFGSPQQSDTQLLSITIEDPTVPPPPLTITTTSPLPPGTVGKLYGTTLQATGGVWPYWWTVVSGSLPPGLTLDSGGFLSGTPMAEGAYSFRVKVTGSGSPAQTNEKDFSLAIQAATAPSYTISGTVTIGSSGTPLPGVLIRGLPGAPTTNASGFYRDTVPEGWSGTATPFKAGYYFVPSQKSYTNVNSDQLNQNYTTYTVELDHFEFSTITSQMAGEPFYITITAKDSSNNTVTTYKDSNTLSDTTGTISPTSTGPFINGVWTGQVTILKAAQGVTITTFGGGKTGESNAFNVSVGVASSIKIEDAADGTGTEVDTKTIGRGNYFTVYAISRNAGNNFVGNVEVNWSLVDKTAGVVDSDLVPAEDNKSAIFTGHAVGTARIQAQHVTLGVDTTGTITVVETQPDDAYEENDSFAGAAEITLGTHTGLVLLDEDWFKFYVPAGAGKDLKVHLKGTSFLDPTARHDLDFCVINSSGKLLSYNISGGADETIYLCDVAPGWYYIGHTYIEAVGSIYSLAIEVSDNFGLGYISGRVTDDQENGIEGAYVELYGDPFNWDISRPLITTDAGGYYKVGYTPGNYTVRFNLPNFYHNDPWAPDVNYIGKTYNSNQIITIIAGETLIGINAELAPGGTITGRVTGPDGNGLNLAGVYVHASDSSRVSFAWTNENGYYTADRMRTGNYKVRFRSPGNFNYGTEWYNDTACFADGLPVPVQVGSITPNINAQLDEGGYIEGRVTNSSGNPIQGVGVQAYDVAGIALASSYSSTNENGYYRVRCLPAGEVKIFFNAANVVGNYVSEYYPDKLLIVEAEPVPVLRGQTTTGIDAQLATGGTITGQVKDAQGNPYPGINVVCFDIDTDGYYAATTDVSGNYTLPNLPPDNYRVRFRPGTGNHAVEWYNDKGAFAAADADDVSVAAGQTRTGLDAQLSDNGGFISGRVTSDGTTRIEGVQVWARDSIKQGVISSVITDANGNYTLPRIPKCQAKVFFNTDVVYFGYESEYYDDKSSFEDADLVSADLGETTSGINAVLTAIPALSITAATLPNGEVGVAYNASLQATGGREFYFWSVISGSVPSGLTLNANGGIRGTPTTSGTFNFTIRVIDSTNPQQGATQSYSITIQAYSGTGYQISGAVVFNGSPLPGVAMTGLPGDPVTNAFGEYTVTVSPGWSATVTPTLAGYAFNPPNRTYTAVSSNYQNQNYTASVGYAISGTVTLSGSPLQGVLISALPGDARTSASGFYTASVPAAWSGTATPSLSGFTFSPAYRTYSNVTSNQTAQNYTANFSASLQVTTSSLPGGTKDSPYSATLQAANGVPPYSWSITSGGLPNGLTLTTSGNITGTPTEAGDFSFTVRAADSTSPQQSASRGLSLTVSPAHQGFWSTTYPLGGRINPLGLVLDPVAPNAVYVAPQWRGVYKSQDGGSSWSSITDHLQTPFDKSNMRIFLVRSSTEFYTVGHTGIYKSTDAGQNWAQIGSSISGRITALALHPTDGNTLYCGTENGEIFKSPNKGSSWSNISTGFPSNEVRAIAVDPVDTSKVYAGTFSKGIYRSISDGAWESANGTSNLTRVEDIAFHPSVTGTIYIAASSSIGTGLFRTTDGGTTWTKMIDTSLYWQPGYFIAVDPANTNIIYAISELSVYKSTDGGSTWTEYPVTGSRLTCVIIDPNNPQTLYAGTEGHGVFKSTSGGQTWSEINNGIRAMNFPHSESHSLHIDVNNPSYIYAGSINGGYRSTDGGQTWGRMDHPGWEISSILTHSSRPGGVFTLRNQFWKSDSNGSSGSWYDPTSGAFCCIQDGDLGVAYPDLLVLYAGVTGYGSLADGVYRSINGGKDWELKNNGLTNPEIDTLTIHPSDSTIIFVSTQAEMPPEPGKNSRLFRTVNGGDNWEHITCGLPDFIDINQIVFYPGDPSIMYIGAEVENGGVYRSDNGGACWYRVLSENVNTVAVHPTNPDIVYAGTWNSGGFYISLNGGQSWTQFNNGLPVRSGIESMALDPSNPYHVFIGTTAGVYEATFSFDFTITTASLPTGIVNEAYSATLEAMGGTPPYTWEIVSGALAPGLGLNQASGEITGVPTAAGTFAFTVKVTDNGAQTFTKNMNITVLNVYVLNLAANPVEGGSVSKNPDMPKYVEGSVVNVAVTTNSGYLFTGWSGDASGRPPLVHVQMIRDKNITANFSLITSLPDYYISSSSWPGTANAGQIIGGSVSVAVGNQGANDPYTGNISVGLYLSADNVITTSDILLWKGRSSIGAMNGGSTASLIIDPNLQIPTTVKTGEYYIGVLVDETDVIAERDESNNAASQTITISSPGYDHLEILGGWPYGALYGIELDPARNLALVSHGGLLQILDISNPPNPVLISQLSLAPASPIVIKIVGTKAYVATGGTGLKVIDISDPLHPAVIGSCETIESNRSLDISGNYAYVTDHHQGFRIIDISNPAAPFEKAFLPFSGRTRLIKVSGNYAYITRQRALNQSQGPQGVQIIDIQDPSNPISKAFIEVGAAPGELDVDSSGRFLFVPVTNNYLRIYDVSNPDAPIEVASYTGTPNPTAVTIVGNYAYVPDQDQQKLVVLDISDVYHPVEISTYRFQIPVVLWIPRVAGNLCFISSWYDSLRIVDFSNLNAPQEVGSYDVVGLLDYADVANNHAFVANTRVTGSRLKVLDISSLSNITEKATLNTPYPLYDLVTSGNHAFLPAYDSGLRVIDISNPSSPAEAGAYEGILQARDVVISGKYAYVADGSFGLRIFDISTPSNPVLVSTWNINRYIQQVAVSGNYVYLAARWGGLRIIDVSDPLNPWEVGFYQFNGPAYNVNVAGDYAFVNDNYNILRIIDVSNPQNPVEVSTFNLYYTYGDIGISGNFLFVPDWIWGVRVIDMSNPANPIEVELLREIGTPEEIFIRENRIYVVNRDTGFYVLEFRLNP